MTLHTSYCRHFVWIQRLAALGIDTDPAVHQNFLGEQNMNQVAGCMPRMGLLFGSHQINIKHLDIPFGITKITFQHREKVKSLFS